MKNMNTIILTKSGEYHQFNELTFEEDCLFDTNSIVDKLWCEHLFLMSNGLMIAGVIIIGAISFFLLDKIGIWKVVAVFCASLALLMLMAPSKVENILYIMPSILIAGVIAFTVSKKFGRFISFLLFCGLFLFCIFLESKYLGI